MAWGVGQFRKFSTSLEGENWRCQLESRNFGPPKKSKSDSVFGWSANIFLDSFGQIISYSEVHAFSNLTILNYAEHNSANDIATCISLITSVTENI